MTRNSLLGVVFLLLFVGVEATSSNDGLIAHWTAEDLDLLDDGTPVSSWIDQVQNVDASQSIAEKQPIFKKNGFWGFRSAVSFDGADDILKYDDPLVGALDFTVVVLFQTTDVTTAFQHTGLWYHVNGLVDAERFGPEDDYGLSISHDGCIRAGIGNPDMSVDSGPGFNDGKPHVAFFRRNATAGFVGVTVDHGQEFLVAGTSSAPRTGTQAAFASIQTEEFEVNHLDGEIVEVLIFDRRLTDDEVEALATDLLPIFVDSFEAGDTSEWSATVP